ncbi:hypothetical protein MWU76_19075 [Gelidibacter sp. F2691]|nr:hypothetical protein [Gelidibacter sp. F2691]
MRDTSRVSGVCMAGRANDAAKIDVPSGQRCTDSMGSPSGPSVIVVIPVPVQSTISSDPPRSGLSPRASASAKLVMVSAKARTYANATRIMTFSYASFSGRTSDKVYQVIDTRKPPKALASGGSIPVDPGNARA